MHNLGIVVDFEFFRAARKWTFWLSALAIPLVILAIGLVMFFSGQSAESAMQATDAAPGEILVHDESGLITESALESFGATLIDAPEAGLDAVLGGQADGFIHYPPAPLQQPTEIRGQDRGIGANGGYTFVARELLRQSVLAELESDTGRDIIIMGIETNLETFVGGAPSEGVNAMIAPGFFLLMFFILLFLLGGQMLNTTTEEKENRVIEIMLTTVQPRTLIIGKILALVMLGLLQVLVVLIPVALTIYFFGDALRVPEFDLAGITFDWPRILVGAVLLVFGFLTFTGVLVMVSAALPTAKEAGAFFGVAMFSAFVPFYAVMALVTDPQQVIVKVFSFFPLTSPVSLLLRNAVGNLETWEIVLGIVILALCSFLSLAAAIHIFRRGTLQYDRRLRIAEIIGRRG